MMGVGVESMKICCEPQPNEVKLGLGDTRKVFGLIEKVKMQVLEMSHAREKENCDACQIFGFIQSIEDVLRYPEE